MPYVLRVLGPENIGLYAYFDSFLSFFILAGLIGIPIYGFREMSKLHGEKTRQSILTSELFSLSLISNLCVSIVYYTIIYLSYSNDVPKLIIGSVLGCRLFLNIFNFVWVYQGIEQFKYITIRLIILRLIYTIGIIYFVNTPDDLFKYVIISLFYFFGESGASLYSLHKFSINVKVLRKGVMKHLPALGTILLMSNSYYLFASFDKVILGAGNNMIDVGYYRTVESIIKIVYQVIVTVAFVSIPKLVQLALTDRIEYTKNLKKLYSLLCYIAIPASVGLFVISDDLIMFYAGSEFINATVPLKLYSIYMIVLVVQGFFASQVLFVLGKEDIITKYFLLIGSMNVIIKLIIINALTVNMTIGITIFLHSILAVFISRYARLKLDIDIRMIGKNLLPYILLSMTFIFIKYSYDLLFQDRIFILILVIFTSMLFYFYSLLFMKDQNSLFLQNIILSKTEALKRKVFK